MSTSLDKIRAQVSGRKLCPNCSQPFTIERTEYFESEVCEHCLDHAVIGHIDICCSRQSLHHVKLITAAKTIQVREQCMNCGKVKGTALGGFTQEQRDRLPLVDESLRQSREEKYSASVKHFYAEVSLKRKAQRLEKKDEWFEAYTRYLQSPEWKKKRDAVLQRDKYLCQCCLDAYATQVHHKNYEFVDLKGSEPAFDLVAICVPCHERIEAMKRHNKSMSA